LGFDELFLAALEARKKAYAPYSGFAVGAALRASGGRVFTGCNVENAAYGVSMCAERVAVGKAVSEGFRDFSELVVVADSERVPAPCGSCRQVLAEFNEGITIHMANLKGKRVTRVLRELLPESFSLESAHRRYGV